MISIRNLSLTLNSNPVLQDITLDLPDNKNTVILGRSGCGKTVLMKCVTSLFTPDAGEIYIDNERINHHNYQMDRGVLNKVGMLFQNAALLDSFTVFQNLALPLSERTALTKEQIHEQIISILQYVGMQQTAELLPSELSGGMRKRIGLARALISNPKYIILDEPTTGLDPLTAQEVLDFLTYVIESRHLIAIAITHDPLCLKKLGEHIVILDAGHVLYAGNQEHLKQTKDEAIAAFYRSYFQ